MPDMFDRAAEIEQQQRDLALKRALTRQTETPRQDDTGRYCTSCSIQIPAARLAAVPNAVRCISCQQERE